MTQKVFTVSWDEFHRNSRALAWRLHQKQAWQKIIAITRGGLIPAGIIARELNIRYVDTICINSYQDRTQGDVKILKGMSDDSSGILVVDDLVDTGKTAKTIKAMLPNSHLATVYAKPEGQPFVDTFVTEVSQDTWIQFPWDLELNYARPIVGET